MMGKSGTSRRCSKPVRCKAGAGHVESSHDRIGFKRGTQHLFDRRLCLLVIEFRLFPRFPEAQKSKDDLAQHRTAVRSHRRTQAAHAKWAATCSDSFLRIFVLPGLLTKSTIRANMGGIL